MAPKYQPTFFSLIYKWKYIFVMNKSDDHPLNQMIKFMSLIRCHPGSLDVKVYNTVYEVLLPKCLYSVDINYTRTTHQY